MILTIALAAGISFLGLLFALLVGWYVIRHNIRSIMLSFVTAPDETTASPLATLIEQASVVFSQRLVFQLKTTVMGMNSVDERVERKEATKEILKMNPTLSAILNFVPGARRLARNPEALAVAAGAIDKLTKGNGGTKEPAPSAGISPFKL